MHIDGSVVLKKGREAFIIADNQTWSQSHNPQGQGQGQGLGLQGQGQGLGLQGQGQGLGLQGVKANVNMVRCSVKTSKHRRLLQGW